jgi:hypothetical protein
MNYYIYINFICQLNRRHYNSGLKIGRAGGIESAGFESVVSAASNRRVRIGRAGGIE